MKKLGKYLESIQKNECGCGGGPTTSSAAGMGFKIDQPQGMVKKTTYPKKKSFVAVLPDDKKKRNKKRKLLLDEQTEPFRHRVLIDFDGVIHKYGGHWNNGAMDGDVIEKVKESIDDIRNTYNNVDIVIFTTRACKSEDIDYNDQIKKLKEFFNKHDIYYDDITGDKLSALIYIDDNGFRFSGDWKGDLPQIKKIIGERIMERKNRK